MKENLTGIKVQGFLKNWDRDSLFLFEEVFDIWSSKFYEKFHTNLSKHFQLNYEFSDRLTSSSTENKEYLRSLQERLGLLDSSKVSRSEINSVKVSSSEISSSEDGDVKNSDVEDVDSENDGSENNYDIDMEEIEEYDIEEDFLDANELPPELSTSKEDVGLERELLLRHTSLTQFTKKIISFIKDECANSCQLHLLYEIFAFPYSMSDLIEESVRLEETLVILFNQEIFVDSAVSVEDESTDKPLFKGQSRLKVNFLKKQSYIQENRQSQENRQAQSKQTGTE